MRETEQQRQPFDPVHQPDRDPISGPDALGDEPGGGFPREPVEFGIADARLAIDQGRRLRPLREVAVEQCRQRPEMGHGHGSGSAGAAAPPIVI
jgi:hypothetical protein